MTRLLPCLFLAALTACSQKTGDAATPAPSAGPATPEATPDAPPKETPQVVYSSLEEAITGTKPMMGDTVNDVSQGAALLAYWASDHLAWNDLKSLPTTKFALVMKDSEEQRGKVICASGRVIEIAAESAADRKFYHGGMYDNAGHIYRFIAVKSTGELIQGSRAAFCGIVTGRQDYANSMGGSAHAVFLVGMFKLKENGAMS